MMTQSPPPPADDLRALLAELWVPGREIELTPEAAEALGAFEETALTEQEAREAALDLLDLEEEPAA